VATPTTDLGVENHVRKALIAAATGLAITIPTSIALAPAADAASSTSGCVTRAEYRKVKNGMTVKKVKRVYGTNGHLSMSSGSFKIRDYKTCSKWHVTNVSFTNGRVTGKLYI
jgi:hypothetical protein